MVTNAPFDICMYTDLRLSFCLQQSCRFRDLSGRCDRSINFHIIDKLIKIFRIYEREKIGIGNERKILIDNKADVTIYDYKKNYLLKEFQMHFTREYDVICHVCQIKDMRTISEMCPRGLSLGASRGRHQGGRVLTKHGGNRVIRCVA